MVNVFFRGLMDCADGFFGGRIDGFESLAILAFDEFVVNKAADNPFSLSSRMENVWVGFGTCMS